MPARDKIHQAVIRALEKRGWRIIMDPFTVSVGERLFYVDVMARHTDGQTILVEIKTFDHTSPITALASAIGKYLLYRRALDHQNLAVLPLVMAIPDPAFYGIFQDEWLQPLIHQQNIRLMSVDIEREEISAWT